MNRLKFIASKLFIIIFSIACVAACVFVANVFASALTVGDIRMTSSSNSNFDDFNIYAISLGKYASKSSAESSASAARQRNAGGFIYQKDGLFYVLASAYEKENDAKLVRESLLNDGLTVEILKISFDDIDLKDVSSSSIEKSFEDSLNIFKTVFIELYDISVSLDTNTINTIKAKIEIISIKAKVEESLEQINKGKTAIDGIYYQMIKSKYNLLIDDLNNLKNYEGSAEFLLSANVKYSYLKIISIAEDLIASLNNEI